MKKLHTLFKVLRVIFFLIVITSFVGSIAVAVHEQNSRAVFGWVNALLWFMLYLLNDTMNDRITREYRKMIELDMDLIKVMSETIGALHKELKDATKVKIEITPKEGVEKVGVEAKPKRGRRPSKKVETQPENSQPTGN